MLINWKVVKNYWKLLRYLDWNLYQTKKMKDVLSKLTEITPKKKLHINRI